MLTFLVVQTSYVHFRVGIVIGTLFNKCARVADVIATVRNRCLWICMNVKHDPSSDSTCNLVTRALYAGLSATRKATVFASCSALALYNACA
jgi:hypothetical protein